MKWRRPGYSCPIGALAVVQSCKNLVTYVPFTKPIWSRPNPYRTTVRTKFGYVNDTFQYQKFGPKQDLLMCKDHGPIKFGPVFGYVNAPCSSDQTKSLTFGGKSQSSNENGELAMWCKLVKRWNLDYYKNLEFILITNIWRKMVNLALLERCFSQKSLRLLEKYLGTRRLFFLENLNLWCASFRSFVIQK